MKKKKAPFVFILFLLNTLFLDLKAQEAVPASGSNASGAGGTASYTIGQMEYTQNNSAAGSVSQGIQIPYEISVVTFISPDQKTSLKCIAYPNPTSGAVNLEIGHRDFGSLSYTLVNSQGKLLETKKVMGSETLISLSPYPEAVYFLNIFDHDKKVETFRIVHN